MAFLWRYWRQPALKPGFDQQTVYSNASSEDFVYNEYQGRDAERRAAPHHAQKHAPPSHGQSETRRLMHRRSRRREEGEDLDSLRRAMGEQGRRASRDRSLCHVRERTTSVGRPTLHSSAVASARGRTGHTARVWNVVSEVESIDFVVGRPKPVRLREIRTYADESDGSSTTGSIGTSVERIATPEV